MEGAVVTKRVLHIQNEGVLLLAVVVLSGHEDHGSPEMNGNFIGLDNIE